MSKIGILTFHRSINYGAALQAYALSSFLRSHGYDAEIIDFLPPGHKKITSLLLPPFSASAIKRDFLFPFTAKYQKRRINDFNYFINNYTPLSKKKNIVSSQLPNVCENYDAVICGSDQIWNPRLIDADESFFLPYGSGFKRIAYAVSLGKGNLFEYNNDSFIREAINKFDYISMREKASLDKLESFSNKKGVIVVDPTLLVDRDVYSKVAAPRQVNRKYIFLYSVEPRERTIQSAKYLAARTNLPVITLFSGRVDFSWIKHKSMIPSGGIGPQEFLSYIRDAEYIVTDSFHGTVLSLIFNKTFFTIANEDKSGHILPDERIDYLSNIFKIQKQIVKADEIKTIDLECKIDWEEFDLKRKDFVNESKNYLFNALGNNNPIKKNVENEDYICPKEKCTGCMACVNRCKVAAIDLKVERDGRVLPHINNKCVQCNACKDVCPQNNPPCLNKVWKCYAVQSKSENRLFSSSGGVGYELMNYVYSNGGHVYGAVVDENLKVKHICANSVDDIRRMQSSKYVFSSNVDVYIDIAKKLKKGETVLYIGTPCQIAGLRKYVGQNTNLYCVDLICHGVPPVKYLEDHIKAKVKSADAFSFRGGKKDFRLRLFQNNKIVYDRFWRDDEYYYAFNESISLQENCYVCPYAQLKRTGDLTIGDFWGLNRKETRNNLRGKVSVVLINSKNGASLFDNIKTNIIFEERDLNEALPGNPNLIKPTIPPLIRESFVNKYKKVGNFENAFRDSHVFKEWKKERLKYSFFPKLVRKARSVIRKK